MVTLMPARLIACVARTASSIPVPATKRPETRRPTEELSAKLRNDEFSERPTKNALSMLHPETDKTRGPICGGRSQNFVSQWGQGIEESTLLGPRGTACFSDDATVSKVNGSRRRVFQTSVNVVERI